MMKKRISYIFLFYLLLLSLFILQKPIFMICNAPDGLLLIDYFDVIKNGFSLDLATSAYFTIIPLLLSIVSIWVSKISFRKILLPYYIFAAFVISVVFISDNTLYQFWQFKLDATVFFYLKSPGEAFASVSVLFVLLKVVEMILYLGFVLFLMIIITPKYVESIRHKVGVSVVFLCAAFVLFVAIRGGFGRSTTNIGQAYFSNNQFLNHSAVNPTFSIMYSLGKTEDFSSEFHFFDKEYCDSEFDKLFVNGNSPSLMEISNKRPNVLLLILEGFGSNLISSLGGEKNIATNFDRIAAGGVLFTNCYGNSFRTDRGLVCSLSGHLGYPTTSIMKIPAKSRTLPAIASSLSKAGYDTEFVYGGDINFTNMQSYLRSTGYSKIVSDVDFSMQERTTNAWGVADHIMFDYVYNEIAGKGDSAKPWFTTFLTLSSHEPYEVPYSKYSDKVFNSVAYTDECLGKFIDKLQTLDVWDDLLVVCIADHGIFYPMDEVRPSPKYFRIPFLLTGGVVSNPGKYESVMSQSDVAATLLGLLGISHDEFIFSRNVLTSEYNDNAFSFYTFNNGFCYADSTGLVVYDNEGGRIIRNENNINTDDKINRGKIILQKLYEDLSNR